MRLYICNLKNQVAILIRNDLIDMVGGVLGSLSVDGDAEAKNAEGVAQGGEHRVAELLLDVSDKIFSLSLF